MNEIELLKAQLEALKQLTEIQKQSIQQLMEQVNRLTNNNSTAYPGIWNPLTVPYIPPLQPHSVPYTGTPYQGPGGTGYGGAGGSGVIIGQGASSGTVVIADSSGNLSLRSNV